MQYLLRAGPAEVFPSRLEQQLVGLRTIERLLLSKHPPALINKQPNGMIE